MSEPNAELAYATLDQIDAVGWLGVPAIRFVEAVAQDAEVETAYTALAITDATSRVRGAWLFDPYNTREDLSRLIAEIFGPRPCPNCPPGYDCERGNYYATEPAP